MKIEVSKNGLAGAIGALGKLVCRTAIVGEYRAVQIEKKAGWLYFRTCNPDEMLEFQVECDSEGDFVSVIAFDVFRNVVKSSKNKTIIFEHQDGVLQINGKSMISINCDWPKASEPPADVIPKVLPDNFLEMLKAVAPVVNRDEGRRVLHGINLSREGVTATNGKELINIPCPFGFDSLTIPFPLALLSLKEAANGKISVWQDKENWLFKISLQNWTWTAKALSVIYPDWQQVIPAQKNLTHSVSFLPERGEQLVIFLKNVPDTSPLNAIKVSMTGTEYLNLNAGNMNTSVAAESPNDWGDFSFKIDKHLLLRLLNSGHTKIEACDGHAPIVATGGMGRYIAMPLFIKNLPQPKKENPKMEENKTIGSVTMPTVVTNHEVETNPMDELNNAIDAFRVRLKNALDESAMLSRKVKEALLMQKQKEREFIQAKRAIERIKLAI